MPNNQTLISVVIPAYNAAETLPACLAALQQQTTSADRYEVIVVDDGSSDATAEIARAAGVRVISQPNAGAAAARNCGVEAANGELILFTDADCAPEADWIAQMSLPFNDPSVAGAKGVYKTEQTGLTPRFVQQEYEDKYDRMLELLHIDFVDTYSAAYRRDIFLKMGGFDTRFPGASVEDQEFSFRIANAGYKMVFAPSAKVVHRHDHSMAEYARRKYFIGYWKSLVLQRYPDKLAKDSHTPQIMKIQIALAALGGMFFLMAAITRRWRLVWTGLGAWGSLLASGWSLYKKIWRRDRPVLLVATLLLFVRAWALGWGLAAGFVRLVLTGQ